jgi:small subunit ribosomal protein S3
MKKVIELTKKADIKGVKIKIAGRLGGKEIAVPNASKRVDFPFKQFALKLIIAAIQFELSMEY